MPEQFNQISDYARQSAVLTDAESIRTIGAKRSRRRLAAQSMGGVGAVAAIAVLSASVSSGSGPSTTNVGAGAASASAGTLYVCPAGDKHPMISEIIGPVPGANGVRVKDPYDPSAWCVRMTMPTGSSSPFDFSSPPPTPLSPDNVAPVPSGTGWTQVTGPTSLPAGSTTTLVRQYGDYFLDVHVPGQSQDIAYSLGYDGPVQVIPLLREFGFTHLTEQVSTDLNQYVQSQPHEVIDVQDAQGHSVVGRQISTDMPLTFIDAPGSTAFPSPSGH